MHSVVSLDNEIHRYRLHSWIQVMAVLLSFLYSGYIAVMQQILEII